MKIGLWAFFGFGNLGDAAIQQAVISNIRSRIPDAEIVAICLDPKAVNEGLSIPAYPIYRGRFFPAAPRRTTRAVSDSTPDISISADNSSAANRKLVHELRKVPGIRQLVDLAWHTREELLYFKTMHGLVRDLDVLIISGSGVLDDTWRGRWRRPFALYRWCLIAKLTKTRLAFISVGATSLNTTLGKYFGRHALRLAEYRSFRDDQSRNLAKGRRLGSSDPVVPDLAYSLDTRQYSRTRNSDVPTVGVGPIPYYDPRVWPENDVEIYNAYIEKFSRLVEALMSRSYRIRFISGEMRVDQLTIRDMTKMLERFPSFSRSSIVQSPISSVDDLLCEIAETDYVISSRFHGVLLPYLLGKPVLSLSYNSKIQNLMTAADQQEYCLDIRHFDVESCLSAFDSMVANRETTVSKLIAQRVVNNDALQAQYDLVFGSPTLGNAP